MPTAAKEAPEALRPYVFHRLPLVWAGSGEAEGPCMMCGREDKFYVSQTTGQYCCKHCGEEGNIYTFMRWMWSVAAAPPAELEKIAIDRRVPVAELKDWGLRRSPIDGEWLHAGYGAKDNITNLYRWSLVKKKRRLLCTSTLDHALFGRQFWDESKPEADVCEGLWDGIAWRWVLKNYRFNGGRLVRTTDPTQSLYTTRNVVAVPGDNTLLDSWIPMFKGKLVTFLYDSDRPRTTPAGKIVPPGGYEGMRKAAAKLYRIAKQINFIDWGPNGFDPLLPEGFDIRDYDDSHYRSIQANQAGPS